MITHRSILLRVGMVPAERSMLRPPFIMTKHTKRDRVWDAALRLAADGKFELDEVLAAADLDESSERTARDVLITMAELGRIDRRVPEYGRQRSEWYDGDTFPREGRTRIPWGDRDRELRETHRVARNSLAAADAPLEALDI